MLKIWGQEYLIWQKHINVGEKKPLMSWVVKLSWTTKKRYDFYIWSPFNRIGQTNDTISGWNQEECLRSLYAKFSWKDTLDATYTTCFSQRSC